MKPDELISLLRFQRLDRRNGSISGDEAAVALCGTAAHEIERLREALRIYGGHIPSCQGRPCSCGFREAWVASGLPESA